MTIFALDIGNKQSKLKSEHSDYAIPSVLVNQRDVQTIFSVGAPKDVNTLKLIGNQNVFYWGTGVLNYDQNKLLDSLGFGNRYDRNVYQLLNEFALAVLGKDFDNQSDLEDVHVVVGLPTGDYTQDTINAVKRIFMEQDGELFMPKTHLITIDNKEILVKVTDVTTLPQPIGTFYNEVIDSDGIIVNPNIISKRIGIVDIGGGTALLDQLVNANLDANYRTQLETGANTLYSQVRSALMQRYGLNADLHKIEILIREGLANDNLSDPTFVYIQSDTNRFDITDLVYDEIRHYTSSLINNIQTTFQNLNDVDMLLVTGGTANIIDKTMFEETFGKTTKVRFTNDSEFANVSGFYKYALLHDQAK